MKTTLAAVLLVSSTVLSSGVQANTPVSDGVRMAPSYPERPVPPRGTHRTVVLEMFGHPAIALTDADTGSDVWDYGTFRVFFVDDEVEFARVW
jgi:hypothetical protein